MYLVRSLFIASAIAFLVSEPATAVTVRAVGPGGNPPQLDFATGDTGSFSVAIELFNESTLPQTLTLWQLSLSIVGESSTSGAVQLVELSASTPAFFESPGPAANPPTALPGTTALVQDVDVPSPMTFPGKTLLPSESRSIVELMFASSSDALGTFYLTLGPFDPFESSAWYDELASPHEFANVTNDGTLQSVVLAQFNFTVPEPSTLALLGLLLLMPVRTTVAGDVQMHGPLWRSASQID